MRTYFDLKPHLYRFHSAKYKHIRLVILQLLSLLDANFLRIIYLDPERINTQAKNFLSLHLLSYDAQFNLNLFLQAKRAKTEPSDASDKNR